MAIIHNTWVEKVKKKKSPETAPAYEAYAFKDDFKTQTRRPEKRHNPALKATFVKTLRGTRK
jgi:hypothetical protein